MKVVGIVLLALLGIVLLLVVLLLFVPFTYRLTGSCHAKKLCLRGRVFGFAGLLGAGVEAREGKWTPYLRILGVKWRLGKKKKPKRSKKQSKKEKAAEEVQEVRPSSAPVSSSTPVSASAPTAESAAEEPKPGIMERILGFWKKITEAVRSFRQTAVRVVSLVADEENQQGALALGGRVFRLLRHLTPRKLKLTLAYSTGSPDTTGQLLGVLALFPMTYQNRWKVTPDFAAEEFYVETDFDVRGHIFGIQILCAAVGILLDKDCQKLYNKFI